MSRFRLLLGTHLALLAMLSTFTNIPTAQAWTDTNIAVSVLHGTEGTDYAGGNAVAIDRRGNIVSIGVFTGTVDFNPGTGTSTLTANGEDMYISKLDQDGNFLWAKSIAGIFVDYAQSIAVDANGNIFMTGYFSGTVDFDPSDERTVNLESAGQTDIFILKLDSSGNYTWAQKIGGPGSDQGSSIALDVNGNIFMTGYFSRTVDFDPSNDRTVSLESAGQEDIFILKLDSSGSYLWAKRVGGSIDEASSSIAVDGTGKVLITGYFKDTADFDPSDEGTANLESAGEIDIFILKLNSSGSYLWAKRVGGSGFEASTSIAIDGNENVLVIGDFPSTVDFDPSDEGTANLESAGEGDIFILKLNPSGSYLWAKRVGGSEPDFGSSIAIDVTGNVLLTGDFTSTVDFDPSDEGTANLTAGESDIFILKLDLSGEYIWSRKIGGTGSDGPSGLVLGADENVAITGYFQGTADFDPSVAGTANITAVGSNDAFIFRLTSSGEATFASLSSPPTSSTTDSAAEAATAAAVREAVREAAKKVARAELVVGFKEAKPATVQKFAEAGISGVNDFNIEAVNSEIALLPESSRTELASILKIARKFEVVGAIASNQVKQIPPSSFVEIGLISADSKYKTSLVNAVRRLDAKDRNSYEAISRALVAESAIIKKRADRMAKIYGRSSERNQG